MNGCWGVAVMRDATTRFTDRVENYVKYRPHYPSVIIRFLRDYCALSPSSVIGDIGSGTGILTRLFLENNNRVYGVEPNKEMREAAEQSLIQFDQFHSVDGTAEATSLPTNSLDFVTAGQAFHWFDRDQSQGEFQRILKPDGWVALVWNEREGASTLFGQEYEQLLCTYGINYNKVTHKRLEQADTRQFFGRDYRFVSYPNAQHFNFAGLKGRLLSSSYSPQPKHPNYAPMLAALQLLFERHQTDDKITFAYQTKLHCGRLG